MVELNGLLPTISQEEKREEFYLELNLSQNIAKDLKPYKSIIMRIKNDKMCLFYTIEGKFFYKYSLENIEYPDWLNNNESLETTIMKVVENEEKNFIVTIRVIKIS